MMTTHLNSDEIQQNSLGILRNLSDSTEGQACSPSHPGGGGLSVLTLCLVICRMGSYVRVDYQSS